MTGERRRIVLWVRRPSGPAAALAALLVISLGTASLAAQSGLPATSSFEELFAEYRRGDAEAALAAFARWPPARVETDARGDPTNADPKTLAALALFHTEAGMHTGTLGQFASRLPPQLLRRMPSLGRGFTERFDIHTRRAYGYVTALRELDQPGTLAQGHRWFVAEWHDLVLLHCVRRQLIACRDELLSRMGRDRDNDPTLLLTIGAAAEPQRTARPGDKRRQIPNFYHGAGQESRWAFQRALRINPALVEARLRLGRVYWVTNERKRAERELTRALAEARAKHLQLETHLAALFLGELFEEQDRMDEAIEHFRIAVSLYPDAHTSALALGQALVRTGRGDEGWLVGREMFGAEGPGVGPAPDPYLRYRQPIVSQDPARLAALRAAIRD